MMKVGGIKINIMILLQKVMTKKKSNNLGAFHGGVKKNGIPSLRQVNFQNEKKQIQKNGPI